MDFSLLRTFIEVTATGSFAAAATKLFVTQSAVSLRIQRLEEELGRSLFRRSKSGATLTPAGTEFLSYAYAHIKLWEEGKQQIAIPDGFTKSVTLGAESSLWPRMGFRWIDTIRERFPELSIRAEVGTPIRLTRFLIEGVVQSMLVYTPQLRPGFRFEKIMDEELVMVASWANPRVNNISDRYLFVDWGPEFVQAHGIHLPEHTNPGITFALGTMAVDYLLTHEIAAYVPARAVDNLVTTGELHLVADAPRFPYPVFHVWRNDLDEEVAAVARNSLNSVALGLEVRQEKVLNQLSDISSEGQPLVLGELISRKN